jgi:hypothetical protein
MNNDNKNLNNMNNDNNKRYFFDGIFWYKKDEGKKLEIMTNDEIEVMKKNTVEGQWLLDGKFENRTDIRTLVTEEKTELQKLTNSSLLIADVNFCTMPDDELMKIFDLCEVMQVLDKTEMVQKIQGKECIEKRWEWYDTLVVTPKEIKFSTSPYPSQTIMTAERYVKLKAF